MIIRFQRHYLHESKLPLGCMSTGGEKQKNFDQILQLLTIIIKVWKSKRVLKQSPENLRDFCSHFLFFLFLLQDAVRKTNLFGQVQGTRNNFMSKRGKKNRAQSPVGAWTCQLPKTSLLKL